MAPESVLMELPAYDPEKLNAGDPVLSMVYKVGHLGNYATGKDHTGRHNGVDIDVPMGTPVVAIASGIVEKTSLQEHGFGHHVVLRHPNVPDPARPGSVQVLHSTYAHLDAILVAEGQIVHKGQQLGLSGKTGAASGPHLHFQIDRGGIGNENRAPYVPWWPSTEQEAKEKGDLYAVSPMLFV